MCSFNNFIHQNLSDIIVGTESWLTNSIKSSKIFPNNYNTYRHDRLDGYRGVFLSCKTSPISEELKLSTTCEMVACKIYLAHGYLIVCSIYYRPPDRNLPYLNELCSTLDQIILSNPNAIIWVGGDLSLPNIDWNLNCVHGNNYPSATRSLDILLYHSLSQIVTFPTRQQNTLDIFITNHPTPVKSCTSIPGISNHDTVCIESEIFARIQKSVPRKIYLWKKANFNQSN